MESREIEAVKPEVIVVLGNTAVKNLLDTNIGITKLRGEFQEAEAAYSRANECGRTPLPGLSLLRLAQGDIDHAVASIRSALVDTSARAARARILAAAVEILLVAADVEGARAADSELRDVAKSIGMPLLSGTSAHATGAVHLADLHEALGKGAPPEAMWRPVLEAIAPRMLGESAEAVDEVPDYELFRAFFSRRSRSQMTGWGTTLDPAQLDGLCIFGPRDDDQPE